MNNHIKYLFIGGCSLIIVIPVLVIIGISAFVFKVSYDVKSGNSYKGATYKYGMALEEGNGEDAIFWAEKTRYFRNPSKYKLNPDGFNPRLGLAYETNGDYEKALANYLHPERKSRDINILLDISRVKYKLSRKRDAFIDYCHYANLCLSRFHHSLEDKNRNTRNMDLDEIRSPITMERSSIMRLSPFLEYPAFLQFMEEEYAKLGSPSEYEAAMQLFRAIAKETNIEHSSTSDKLDAMRAKILAERKQIENKQQ